MSGGNTLLAHAVGAGKTFTMAATGMKMKQAGLIKKPMYVVPNHMLEQFAREFMQLYPNARLLVAAKEDLTTRPPQAPDRQDRQRRVGRHHRHPHSASSGSACRGTTRSSSSASRSPSTTQLLCDARQRRHARANRNIIKTIEKQKAAPRGAAEGPARRGQEGRRAGVRRAGRRPRLHRRGPVLQEPGDADQDGARRRHPDRRQRAGLRPLHEGPLPATSSTPATASPSPPARRSATRWSRCTRCSGSSTPRGCASRGIEHFDAWAATFGEVVDTMEISPDGASLAAPQPLRPLHQPARTPADVPGLRRRADGRDARPAPARASKAASPSSSPARCRTSSTRSSRSWSTATSGCGRRRSIPREDNALAITTDGRKLALDARMLSRTARRLPRLEDQRPGRQRRRHLADAPPPTRGTQMIFCDMGVNPTPWGYSAYDEIIDEAGRPRHPPRADRRHRRRRHRRQEAGPVREGPAAARSAC